MISILFMHNTYMFHQFSLQVSGITASIKGTKDIFTMKEMHSVNMIPHSILAFTFEITHRTLVQLEFCLMVIFNMTSQISWHMCCIITELAFVSFILPSSSVDKIHVRGQPIFVSCFIRTLRTF